MAAQSADMTEMLLRRLEMEYHSVVKATRAPVQAPATALDDEAAFADAEAQGYGAIGLNVSEDEEDGEEDGKGDGEDDRAGYACIGDDDEDEEDGDALQPDGFEALGVSPAADAAALTESPLPTSFIESALPDRKAFEASLTLPTTARAIIERTAREELERHRSSVAAEAAESEREVREGVRAGLDARTSWLTCGALLPCCCSPRGARIDACARRPPWQYPPTSLGSPSSRRRWRRTCRRCLRGHRRRPLPCHSRPAAPRRFGR